MKRLLSIVLTSTSILLQPGSVLALSEDELSRTAVIAAMFRAIGATNPDPAFRNPDTLARGFVGPDERKLIAGFPMLKMLDMEYEAAIAHHRQLTQRAESPMAAHFVRTRRIDELLTRSVANGAVQVVILGAGFDSRPYRLQGVFAGVRVFEVDHPRTQAYKKRKIEELIGTLPTNIVYTPVDFTVQDLHTELARAGYQTHLKTFFVWEGVTYYLPAEAVSATLRFVGEHTGPGSEIVFDYAVEEAMVAGHGDDRLHRLQTNAARFEEPWMFGMAPDAMAVLLDRNHLRVVSDLGKLELERQYLTRNDGETVDGYPWWWRICHAAVVAN